MEGEYFGVHGTVKKITCYWQLFNFNLTKSIRKTILILGSIRRPKRITVHGSNEKDY